MARTEHGIPAGPALMSIARVRLPAVRRHLVMPSDMDRQLLMAQDTIIVVMAAPAAVAAAGMAELHGKKSAPDTRPQAAVAPDMFPDLMDVKSLQQAMFLTMLRWKTDMKTGLAVDVHIRQTITAWQGMQIFG